VDGHGRIYVADSGGKNSTSRIAIFSAGSKGNVTPIAAIVDKTELNDPLGLTLDSADDIYVLNSNGSPASRGSITVYLSTENGNVAPKATIANGIHNRQTQFDTPTSMALDSVGNIYVTNAPGTDSITIYAAGKFGDVAPITVIAGPHTGLNLPHGIAIAADGKIYVNNDGSDNHGVDTVTVHALGSHGDTKPIPTISGSLTGLIKPAGLAVGP
jgi:hypothetical protein